LLLQQNPQPAEILVIDQSSNYSRETVSQLQELHDSGKINWLIRDKPSIPQAMNHALLTAKFEIVLFLDDDIIPDEGLIQNHLKNYENSEIWAVAGQVLQPGQHSCDTSIRTSVAKPFQGIDFPFNSTKSQFVTSCMAGNFSVKKENAIQIGGFDENFIGDAYRFEAEFCMRIIQNGGAILFEPEAKIQHLQIHSGGVRSFGDHRKSPRPEITVGEYYFTLLQYCGFQRIRHICNRFLISLGRKFYLKYPWWLPVKLYAEIRGLFLAARLKHKGPVYIQSKGT
jgi:GT2 family glycosyltransferase